MIVRHNIQGDVIAYDRGSLALASRRAIDRHGGFCIVRAKADLNPQVHGAFREEGKRLKSAQRRDVKAIVSTLPKRPRPPCPGAWRLEREPFALRLIVRGHPQTKALDSLFTNLAPSRYSIHSVCLGDKLRGQVERLVTAGKSPAHLHAFETEKETLAEALIWASLGAAALTRCWAHAAESLLEGVISTHKAAMSPAYGFPEWCRSLWQGDGPWDRRAFARMIG